MNQQNPKICIIGAGMSGILMGIELRRQGFTNFQILEKGNGVGGTWRDNTYPGLHCDVPSVSYCYSFEPNPNWSQCFASGPEIQKYFEDAAQKYELLPFISFNKEVTAAEFKDEKWHIHTRDGAHLEADFLINAGGVLHYPKTPEFKGLASFEGHAFHSAQWRHDVDLRNKRVAVIGTGSTSTQLVVALSSVAKNLYVFQRTPQWVLPAMNRRFLPLERGVVNAFPVLRRIARAFWDWFFNQVTLAILQDGLRRKFFALLCKLHLKTVRSPELRAKLTPNYQPLCKRLVISEYFYKAIQQPNVFLETDGIDSFAPKGIVTRSGNLHELDCVVFATGYDVSAHFRKIKITGEHGRSLDECWQKGNKAYKTVAAPGFPNFFMLIGPNSPIGNFSFIKTAEMQTKYIVQWISLYREGKFKTTAPRMEVTNRYNDELVRAMASTLWTSGCQSWYLGPDGVPNSWPWSAARFELEMASPKIEEFQLR